MGQGQAWSVEVEAVEGRGCSLAARARVLGTLATFGGYPYMWQEW